MSNPRFAARTIADLQSWETFFFTESVNNSDCGHNRVDAAVLVRVMLLVVFLLFRAKQLTSHETRQHRCIGSDWLCWKRPKCFTGSSSKLELLLSLDADIQVVGRLIRERMTVRVSQYSSFSGDIVSFASRRAAMYSFSVT